MTPLTAQQYKEAVERTSLYVVELPWPDRRLHPNARLHHMAKAKAVKQAREDTAWLARSQGVEHMDADSLKIRLVFHAPDRRRRDIDGMLSSMKPALDALADITGVDDSNWDISMRKGDPCPNGCVRIFLGRAP